MLEFESGPPDRLRLPRRVFDHGTEPDPLYTLANERTYLSWLRLAITLMAAAVAVDRLFLLHPWFEDQVLALCLVVISLGACVIGVHRWTSTELALRLRRPLPGFGVPLLSTMALVLVGCGVALLVVLPRS